MVFNRGFKKSKVKNQRGQVAIFIALIFQVLFLFFAMIINVGLLVHHKINLQNSVDLAAYYGAMKQAETMNAIGHINYQIRQSWKLLAWRYRQLGTAGTFSPAHPYNKPLRSITGPLTEDILPEYEDFYNAPAFCITYIPFRPMPAGENTCKKSDGLKAHEVKLFKPPNLSASFIGLSVAMRAATQRMLTEAVKRCKVFGTWNYVTLGRFVTTYVMDQAEKKLLMRHLALGISESQDEMRDLSGDSVRVGIEQTLKRNLTEPNRSSVTNIKLFNSLGTADCGADSGAYDPPKWLNEIRIHPVFAYTDTSCNNDRIRTAAVPLTIIPQMHGDLDIPLELRGLVEYYHKYVSGALKEPYNYSIGYEKNPWCMAYVGVSAMTTPKIPFAPLGEVSLIAKAYAKPFGGKIGPWYGKIWRRGPTGVNGGSDEGAGKIDELLPPRGRDITSLGPATVSNYSRVANYSKYPGDRFGMKSLLTLGQYGRAIFQMDRAWQTYNYKDGKEIEDTSVGGGTDVTTPNEEDSPNFFHWDHLGADFKIEGHGDILAYDGVNKRHNQMRELETIAIAPDLFDAAYYSIEPNYYNVYFKKIRDGYLPKKGGYTFLPRSDIGSRVGDRDLESFSVGNQVELVTKLAGFTPRVDLVGQNALNYILAKGTEQLLTSWVGKSLSDYSFDSAGFGKCAQRPLPNAPTSGDCLGPGRTGYSVKLVAEDYLLSPNHEVGGDGAGRDRIINGPPGKDYWGF